MENWHKKDAAQFEVHVNKRKGNKAKMMKAQAVVDQVWMVILCDCRLSVMCVVRRSIWIVLQR